MTAACSRSETDAVDPIHRLGDDEKPAGSPRRADLTELGADERLVTSPKGAAYMLDCGVTHVYELLKPGEPDPDGKPTEAPLES